MIARVDNVRSGNVYNPQSTSSSGGSGGMTALQMAELSAAIGRAMSEAAAVSSRMTDGFDNPPARSTGQTGVSKKQAAPKKKSGGLFGKIAGFLKKVLPIVSKIASFIPGLQAFAKPLELASSFLNRAQQQ